MDRSDIRTCRFCGRLFRSYGSGVCPECNVKLDADFIKIRDYIYKEPDHADVNVNDIAENTGVSERAILYLMKEGRLSQRADTPGKYLKCAICGEPISTGRLCRKCMSLWNEEMKTGGPSEDSAQDRGRTFKKNEKMHTDH